MNDEKMIYYCTVCDNIMSEPIILSCLHTFCKSCVKMRKNCPIRNCNEPIANSNNFHENLLYKNIVQSYYDVLEIAMNQEGNSLLCNSCTSEPPKKAVLYCLTCKESMCRNDFQAHKRFLTGVQHIELKINDSEMLEDVEIKPIPAKYSCSVHTGEETLFCCLDDNCTVCEKCIELEHSSHNFVDLKKHAVDLKEDIHKKVSQMTRGKENNREISTYYRQKIKEIQEDEVELLNKITFEFNQKIKTLETHREKLLLQVKHLSKQNQELMESMMERQQGLIDKLNQFKRLSQPYLYDYPITYLIDVGPTIQKRIQKLEQEFNPDDASTPKKIVFDANKLHEITANVEEFGLISLIGNTSLSFYKPPRIIAKNIEDEPLKPQCLALNEKGQCYVLRSPIGACDNYCVDYYSPYASGNKLVRHVTDIEANTKRVRFSRPIGMSISKMGTIAIADSNISSVYVFDIDFSYLCTLRGQDKICVFLQPIAIGFSTSEELAVAYSYNSCVVIFTDLIEKSPEIQKIFYLNEIMDDSTLFQARLPRLNPIVHMSVNSKNHIFVLVSRAPWVMIYDFQGDPIDKKNYKEFIQFVEEFFCDTGNSADNTVSNHVKRRYDTPVVAERSLLYIDTMDNMYIYHNSKFAMYDSHYRTSKIYSAENIEEPICFACDDFRNVYFCTENFNIVIYGPS